LIQKNPVFEYLSIWVSLCLFSYDSNQLYQLCTY